MIVTSFEGCIDLLWDREDLDFVVIEDFLFTKKKPRRRETNA
jgi:hypothetical protein